MPESYTHEAVVAGHICLDLTPRFAAGAAGDITTLMAPGKLIGMDGIEVSTGGAVANTGIALGIMGVSTVLMCKVGQDAFGSIVRGLVRERGPDSGVKTVSGARTSYTVILAPPQTDRIFLHDAGANDTFSADDVDYDLVAGAKLFHFGYPPLMARMYERDGEELVSIFSRGKAAGVTTSLDMAMPGTGTAAAAADWKTIVQRVLPFVDIFIPSLEEILLMLRPEEYGRLNANLGGHELMDAVDLSLVESLLEEMAQMGAPIAGIKCGKLGFALRTAGRDAVAGIGPAAPGEPGAWADRLIFAPSFAVPQIRSATGAGDSSVAAFLAALLTGCDPHESVDLACLAGARTVQVYDALGGAVGMETLREELRRAPDRTAIGAVPSHWSPDGKTGHWTQ